MTKQPMSAGAKFRYAMQQEQPLQVKSVIHSMQTRNELYDYLDYHSYETKLDQLFAKEKS